MSNVPLVIHFIRSLTAERTGCGRYVINVYNRTINPGKVTCRACLAAMAMPARPVNTEENVNA